MLIIVPTLEDYCEEGRHINKYLKCNMVRAKRRGLYRELKEEAISLKGLQERLPNDET